MSIECMEFIRAVTRLAIRRQDRGSEVDEVAVKLNLHHKMRRPTPVVCLRAGSPSWLLLPFQD